MISTSLIPLGKASVSDGKGVTSRDRFDLRLHRTQRHVLLSRKHHPCLFPSYKDLRAFLDVSLKESKTALMGSRGLPARAVKGSRPRDRVETQGLGQIGPTATHPSLGLFDPTDSKGYTTITPSGTQLSLTDPLGVPSGLGR